MKWYVVLGLWLLGAAFVVRWFQVAAYRDPYDAEALEYDRQQRVSGAVDEAIEEADPRVGPPADRRSRVHFGGRRVPRRRA